MASSSENTVTMIRLKTLDNEVFEVEESIASQITTIKNMIDDDCAAGVIPLPNVAVRILAKVIEYCKKHAEVEGSDQLSEDEKKATLKGWDSDFVKEVKPMTLLDIAVAANYLAHKGLMDLTFQVTADLILNMTPEDVRSNFNIENDFSPQEEDELIKQSSCVFEK